MQRRWPWMAFNRKKRNQEYDIQRLRCKVQDYMEDYKGDTEGWFQKVLGDERYEEMNAAL